MTSPYAMRARTQLFSPNPNGQLFKTFENSPKAASRYPLLIETHQSKKIATAKTGEHTTPRNNKLKTQQLRSNISNPELNNGEPHSNSLNQSSVLQGKFRRADLDFQRTQQNALSMSNEHSFVFAHNDTQKQIEKIESKLITEDKADKQKKSYRKQNSCTNLGVPYRKCHSSMQEKVVSIINKIKSGKDCHKQIETLIDRTKKVSIKQLNNRYFVSGVQLIYNLSLGKQYKQIFTYELVKKLNQGLQQLKNRILAELDNTKGFQIRQATAQEICFQKLQLVRRAYKVLRKKLRNQKREEVQNRALKAADWFLNNKINDLQLFYEELAQC